MAQGPWGRVEDACPSVTPTQRPGWRQGLSKEGVALRVGVEAVDPAPPLAAARPQVRPHCDMGTTPAGSAVPGGAKRTCSTGVSGWRQESARTCGLGNKRFEGPTAGQRGPEPGACPQGPEKTPRRGSFARNRKPSERRCSRLQRGRGLEAGGQRRTVTPESRPRAGAISGQGGAGGGLGLRAGLPPSA